MNRIAEMNALERKDKFGEFLASRVNERSTKAYISALERAFSEAPIQGYSSIYEISEPQVLENIEVQEKFKTTSVFQRKTSGGTQGSAALTHYINFLKLWDEESNDKDQYDITDSIDLSKEVHQIGEYRLNSILYGPPGTGKTYSSVLYSVAIIEKKSIDVIESEGKKNYAEVKQRFDAYRNAGRIAFTTFHQSYGYEEFIEGIKPIVDAKSSELSYKIEPGIFKKFCTDSKKKSLDGLKISDTVWVYRNRAGDSDVPFDFEKSLYSKNVIMVESAEDKKRQCDFIKNMSAGDWVVLGRNYFINAIGVIADEGIEEIDNPPFHVKRRVDWKVTGINVDCRSINLGKSISNFAIAKSWMKASDLQKLISEYTRSEQPCVFIIDEINRGNISKIFGELITLIEDTKREGMPEAASAILPYSRETFSVPSNVYILGTMNTADRSIALMDTALRRRFKFVEMMPDTGVLEGITVSVDGDTLDVSAMLKTINDRIEYLYDREHTIGHAFFTRLRNDNSIECLSDIFRNNVVPLLQEYFYEDYEKIQLVLGDNDKSNDDYKFVLDKKVNEPLLFKKSPQLDLHEKTYEIQSKAFKMLQSYIEITETRKAEN